MRKRLIVAGGVAAVAAMGAMGAAAAFGTAVTAGPNGLAVQTVSHAYVNYSFGKPAIVRCPVAKPYVLSGGYTTPGMNTQVIGGSHPVGGNPNGWEIDGFGNSPTHLFTVTVYAVCSK